MREMNVAPDAELESKVIIDTAHVLYSILPGILGDIGPIPLQC